MKLPGRLARDRKQMRGPQAAQPAAARLAMPLRCEVSRQQAGVTRLGQVLASPSLCTVWSPTYLVSSPLKSPPFPPGTIEGPVRIKTRCQDRINLELTEFAQI